MPRGGGVWDFATYLRQSNLIDFLISSQFHILPLAVSAQHKLSDYLGFLKTNATMCLVGIPPEPHNFHATEIQGKRLKIGEYTVWCIHAH